MSRAEIVVDVVYVTFITCLFRWTTEPEWATAVVWAIISLLFSDLLRCL